MEWKDQYKSPKWQKKRLDALSEAEYVCEVCGDSESQLHVHHKRYVKGRMIWEYEISELSVLCESCHKITHKESEELKKLIAMIHPDGIQDLIDLLSGYCSSIFGPCHASPEKQNEDSVAWEAGRLAAEFQEAECHRRWIAKRNGQ